MTRSTDKPISAIKISPESARVIEASIAAGTSGAAFWVLQMVVGGAALIALVAAIGFALYFGAAALSGNSGALEMLAFAVVGAFVFGTFVAMQVSFLIKIRRR